MGNTALDFDSCALGYHGVTHDAAGYLLNYAQVGPGYDYLGRERGLGAPPTSELVGHREGLYYWRQTVGADPASQQAEQLANAAVPYHQGTQAATELRERAGRANSESQDAARAVALGAAAATAELAQGNAKAAAHLAQGVAQATQQALRGGAQAAVHLAQGVGELTRVAATSAAQVVTDAARGALDAGGAAARSPAEAGRAVVTVLADGRDAGMHAADGARQVLAQAAQSAADITRDALAASQQAAASFAAQYDQARQDGRTGLGGSSASLSVGAVQAALHIESAATIAGQLASDAAFTIEQQLRALKRRWDDL
jgi:hypothetical protein